MNRVLIDLVVEQIGEDVHNLDFTAIEELVQYIPENVLREYLTEEKQFELYEMESPR